jgi:hypothetical protein
MSTCGFTDEIRLLASAASSGCVQFFAYGNIFFGFSMVPARRGLIIFFLDFQ